MNVQLSLPVVVGVEGGSGSAGALRYAVAEAVRRQAPLQIVHVVPTMPMVPGPLLAPFVFGTAEMPTELREVGTAILSEAAGTARHLAPALDVTTVLGHGQCGGALVETSQGAQLLVVGHETRSGLERAFAGATTAGIASRAGCDVVVVPPSWTGDHPSGRIVAGLKSESQARQLLPTAFAEASARGDSLTLVTAWELPDPYLDRIELRTRSEEWEADGRRVVADLVAGWRLTYPEVPVEVRIEHGRPATVLLDVSRGSDLLLVCRRRHGMHVHGHLGGVAYAVLGHSEIPVQVISSPTDGEADSATPELVLEADDRPLR